jgi:hypothetical protein
MRDIKLGICSGVTSWIILHVTLLLMLAFEGIGPGDSLSPLGFFIPVAVTALGVMAWVRTSGKRLLVSLLVWSPIFVAAILQYAQDGSSMDQDVRQLAFMGLLIKIPATLIVLINRLRD